MDIVRDEGARGFYRGVATSVIQIAPYMGLVFGTYERTRKALVAHTTIPTHATDFVAGGIAGIVGKCAVFPLDTVRKRLQVQGPTREKYVYNNIPLYNQGVIQCLKDILRHEGVKGLYKGLWVALAKSGPSAAVTLWVFQGSLRIWHWIHQQQDTDVQQNGK
jgi:solute carrier family 25 (mitochondrial thiamine pyrophosphate transporter), member 19